MLIKFTTFLHGRVIFRFSIQILQFLHQNYEKLDSLNEMFAGKNKCCYSMTKIRINVRFILCVYPKKWTPAVMQKMPTYD